MSEEKSKSTLGNILTVVGFIVIVLIGIWAAVSALKIAPQMLKTISGVFSRPNTHIEIALDSASVNANEPFDMSWEHDEDGGGSYAFSYQCRTGVSLSIGTDGGQYSPLACETPYSISPTKQSVRIIPFSTLNRYIDVPFVIAYFDEDDNISAQGENTITIVNESVQESPDSVAGGDSGTAGTTPTPTPAAHADLAASIIAVGEIDSAGGTFVPRDAFYAGRVMAVRFEVRNNGAKESGSWGFNASLPTSPQYTYTSETQRSLAPGDWIEYTLRFDQLTRGSGTFTVTADPSDNVAESNESNNSAQITFFVQ